MDPKFFRRYADLITEAEQPKQLDEGVMDTIKQYASKLTKALDPATLKQIVATVKQATGGDYSLTRANAQKAAQALGAPESGQEQMAEGISPTLGGKIAQALHLGAIGGAIPLAGATGGLSVAIGFIALMFIGTFWGNEPGQLGSEYDQIGNQLGHAEIRPKPGVTPKKPNPGFDRGGSNIG